MFEKTAMLFLYVETPLHAGSGTSLGIVDLPIQREQVTNWPIIQPSGVKGALREYFEKLRDGSQSSDSDFGKKTEEVFGPGEAAEYSGAASFTEAKVLFFPIRSLKGTFAYVTCPLALERFRRDLETLRDCNGTNLIDAGQDRPAFPVFPDDPGMESVWVAAKKGEPGKADSLLTTGKDHLVFEELSFKAKPHPEIGNLAEWILKAAGSLPWLDSGHLSKRLAIVSDDMFKDFVEMSTEVITRNRIDDETGTVQQGALWIEEHLPRETVLYSLIFAAKPFVKESERKLPGAGDVLNFITGQDCMPRYIWIGGNTTVGRGLVRLGFI